MRVNARVKFEGFSLAFADPTVCGPNHSIGAIFLGLGYRMRVINRNPYRKTKMSRILITSALPYINGVKHLGNLVGSMLPADVYARYMRMRGHEVLAICATDEHGTPAELAALEEELSVEEYCAKYHKQQKAFGDAFGLEWDYFGRSSSDQNTKLTQHFAELLEEAGLIEERVDEQVFSIDDDRFLPDRYIEGTCPKCDYERARGDQCDNCGSLLDPVDLKDAYSTVSGSKTLRCARRAISICNNPRWFRKSVSGSTHGQTGHRW